jgi:hypothetical protein
MELVDSWHGLALQNESNTGDAADILQIQELLKNYALSVDKVDLDLANHVWSHAPEVKFIHPRGTERGLEAVEKNFYGKTMGNTFSERELLL